MVEKMPRQEIERRENTGEKLDRLMLGLAERVNKEFSGQIGGELLNRDGTINMEVFRESLGGPLEDNPDFDEVPADEDGILAKERQMSAADNPRTQAYYEKEKGVRGEEEILAYWREQRENSPTIQAEKLITALLDRVLGKRFLIARASCHDDYENSVDTLIIDRETGEVVGAFDEVLDTFHREGKTAVNQSKKWEKISKKNAKGGAHIKYGLTFGQGKDSGKLIRKELSNVPIFYLSLSGNEFKELAENIEADPDTPLSSKEAEIFDELMKSLSEQREGLLKQNISGIMKPKIASFSRVIDNMKEARESLAPASVSQAA
ncbi:MAG: hypothetical protein PHZ04_02440 [Patescibacteria group bacterium]|nr:hypothetical protein [Patescibacteria group bacterium]MDD5294682.1 hypothetical protein [Patescibacteria group bacterium]MDD5554454.1 hypothetical protein [Patescibacteria group bacterium]